MFTIDEHPPLVNGLLGDVAHVLAERGVRMADVSPAPPDTGVDAELTLRWRHASRRYLAEVKETWNRASVARAATTSRSDLLVVTRHMSPALAAQCRGLGLHFADASGNVFLDWGDLVLDVEGRRGADVSDRHPLGPLRTFQPSGLRVLFALLCRRDLVDAPFRRLAEAADVAVGTVHRVMRELETSGHLEDAARARLLHGTRGLFDRWVEAYVLSLEPRLTLGRFESDDLSPWLDCHVAIDAYGGQWGGEAAAARLTRRLRPATAVVYVPERVPRELLRSHRLRPAPHGDIVFRNRFWRFGDAQPFVPSLLVYADLVASGDVRQVETAQVLRTHDEDLRRLDAR